MEAPNYKKDASFPVLKLGGVKKLKPKDNDVLRSTMSYQGKRMVTGIVTGILVLAVYCIYAFGRFHTGSVVPDDLKFWASTMLIFIGIGIAASIMIQIMFHILLAIFIAVKKKIQDKKCEDKEIEKKIQAEIVEDVMDRLIDLKLLR